ETGVQPKVTAALGRDRQRALTALGQAQARDLPTRLGEAVRTARALVGADPRAEIHVFTDGAFAPPSDQAVADPPIRWVGAGGGVVTARLRIDDDLAVDDVAYAVLPPPRKINVLLVSPGNLFLEKVLRTDPQVSLEVRTPDQYAGGMAEADVAVLDSVTPPRV